jgi:hypothetical protein
MLPTVAPCHRYQKIAALAEKKDAEPPADPLDLALFNILRGQTDNQIVATAYEIYRSPYHHVMDALCLCAANATEVESALELREGVYAVYQTLFFDRTVFNSVFAMRQYVEQLQLTKNEREIYELALIEGATRLLDRYRLKPRPALDPQVVLEDIMNEAYSRAFEHRGKPITSKAAQESFKWGRAAAATAATIKSATATNRVSDALAALEFALTSKSLTKTPEELGITRDEILKE